MKIWIKFGWSSLLIKKIHFRSYMHSLHSSLRILLKRYDLLMEIGKLDNSSVFNVFRLMKILIFLWFLREKALEISSMLIVMEYFNSDRKIQQLNRSNGVYESLRKLVQLHRVSFSRMRIQIWWLMSLVLLQNRVRCWYNIQWINDSIKGSNWYILILQIPITSRMLNQDWWLILKKGGKRKEQLLSNGHSMTVPTRNGILKIKEKISISSDLSSRLISSSGSRITTQNNAQNLQQPNQSNTRFGESLAISRNNPLISYDKHPIMMIE